MADILHDFPINAPMERVFRCMSEPAGLDMWWSETSDGTPSLGAEYKLGFGPDYNWSARVTRYVPHSEFELEMTDSDSDWNGSRVGFSLEPRDNSTWVRFYHTGWPDANEHFRISNCCWAMYLRVLRRNLEFGETVPYEKRLDV